MLFNILKIFSVVNIFKILVYKVFMTNKHEVNFGVIYAYFYSHLRTTNNRII